MNNTFFSAFRVSAVASLMALLLVSGCVTTTSSVYTKKASPEQALQKRVELARQYIGEGNWADAKRNLKMAYKINPKSAEVHEAFALVYQSTGEYELAEENYRTALRLDPNLSRARNNYAVYLFSRQRYQDAAAQLEQVIQDSLYDGRPRAFINLGLCRLQLAEYPAAEAAFRRALAMDRTNVIALLQLANLRYDDHDYVAAQRYYDTYRTIVRRQSAQGLWLGIRLASVNGDKDAQSSYALALGSLYPKSPEYEAYQRSQHSER